jgi:hypothetical protein
MTTSCRLLPIFLFIVNSLVAQELRHGTVIIAIKTDTALVVGCDSRTISDLMVRRGSKEVVEHDTTNICKIRNVRNLYWAMSGFTNNDLYGMLSQAALQTGRIEPAARVCSKNIHDYMVHVIDSLRIHDEIYYNHFYDLHSVNISKTIFFGIEEGKYILNIHEYSFKNSKGEPTDIADDETADNTYKPNELYFIPIANGSALRNLQDKPDSLRYYVSHFSADSIVKLFLQREIDVNPECGGPLDIVIFDSGGARWCVPKRDCHY